MFRAIRSDGRPIGRMTGKPEVYPKPDNWIASVVFGQRDVKLSRSRLRGDLPRPYSAHIQLRRFDISAKPVSGQLPCCRQTNRNASRPPVFGLNKRIGLLAPCVLMAS